MLPRTLIAWIVIITLLVVPGCAPRAAHPTPTHPPHIDIPPTPRPVGNRPLQFAPDFILDSAQNYRHQLSGYRGQPVMLNFFATWCGPCLGEIHGIQDAYDRYGKLGLAVVSVDEGESRDTVAYFAEEQGLTFPMLLDENKEVGRLYGVRAIPTTFFIDSKGVIQYIYRGSMDESTIARYANLVIFPEPEPPRPPSYVAQPAPEPTPTAPRRVKSRPGKTIEGCVNVGSALVRSGPGEDQYSLSSMAYETCAPFDAQSADGAWLRLAEPDPTYGSRRWVAAEYITLKGAANILPVAE